MAERPAPPGSTDPHARTVVSSPQITGVAVPSQPSQPSPGAHDARSGGRLSVTEDAPLLVAHRYEILGMLGAGGMGTVYRARDRELEETVAIKVLRKELAAADGMLERFRREVKLARRVTHRNVARTFDIGEYNGDRFLTMELIEGEMLGSHLARRGRVPLREVIAIGRDVCAGLAAAHAADVLHRDLKPENVIIARDGRAVITDFGIARALAQAELGRTAAGGLVGTPAYMAPEQVEGATDLDGRADLYALGTMLFELLTGEMAWPGDSAVAIAASRILRPPPDARKHVPELPESAALLVLKLMARARDDRYATAEEAGEALAELAGADLPSTRSLHPRPPQGGDARPPRSRPPSRRTVAVLPLSNLGASDDAYLAQTLTEDLVDLLSVVPELRVRPRGETARFFVENRDVREAGRLLDVDVVVDGSVRRVGDSVRVAVRLVTVEDGFQLWAGRFDRAPAAVLSVADEAASAIARALAAERTAEHRPAPVDAIAQDLYLRGRFLVQGGWFEVSREGVEMLREAHQRAPSDTRIAGAYALAIARVLTADPDSFEATTAARELAERTLEADPSQADARVALGFLHLNNGEGAAAAVQLKRALAASPNSVEALDASGRVLVEVGRVELGMATLRRALAIEPSLTHARQAIARAHALLGDLESMHERIGPLPDALADLTVHLLARSRVAMWRGDVAEADAVLRDVEARPDLSPHAIRNVLAIVGATKTKAIVPAFVNDMGEDLSLDKRFTPRRISFHAQLRVEMKLACNAVEAAWEDLRVADANGLLDLVWLDRCPLFDGVRHFAAFRAVHESTSGRAERVIRVLDP